jgi:disulfide bond formation protein DsbB
MVPLAGIEPALLAESDFESDASTSSAIGAMPSIFEGGYHARCWFVNLPIYAFDDCVSSKTAENRALRSGRHSAKGTEFMVQAQERLGQGWLGQERMGIGLVLVVAIAVLGGAWFIELVLGYAPCALCLQQRWPWYAAGVLALAGLAVPQLQRPVLIGLFVLMLVSVALGVHHAGVEWQWWKGPESCSGTGNLPGSAGGLLDAIATTKPPSCTEALFTFGGFSLAVWNATASFFAALFVLIVLMAGRGERAAA